MILDIIFKTTEWKKMQNKDVRLKKKVGSWYVGVYFLYFWLGTLC